MARQSPDKNARECRRGWVDWRSHRVQRANAELGANQRPPAVRAPATRWRGLRQQYRGPDSVLCDFPRRASSGVRGVVSVQRCAALGTAHRRPDSGSASRHGRRGVTLLVARRSFGGTLCGWEVEAREPRRRCTSGPCRCLVGLWRHVESKRRHRLCPDASGAVVACAGRWRHPESGHAAWRRRARTCAAAISTRRAPLPLSGSRRRAAPGHLCLVARLTRAETDCRRTRTGTVRRSRLSAVPPRGTIVRATVRCTAAGAVR